VERGFAGWNNRMADALAAVGTPGFARQIERALSTILTFDIAMIFSYQETDRPDCFYHNMDTDREAIVNTAYVQGAYLLDPFFGAVRDPSTTGILELQKLAPDHFYNSQYYRQHYGRTGIRDEIGILCRPNGLTGLVFSITRPMDAPLFGRKDIQTLKDAQPLVQALAERHWDNSAAKATRAKPQENPDPINATLNTMAEGVLTPRELEITSLVLKGHSSHSIAERLNIVEGTVKIHRKHIYQKLAISSQSELFSMFIHHLSRQTDR